MNNDLNWQEIQKYYDDNHSWRDCMKKYNFSWGALTNAKNRGDIKSRTNKEGLKIRFKIYGTYKHTQETKDKLSKIRIKYLTEHPDQVPYLLNHYSKGDSYPETYFKELIDKEQLPLQFHKQIGLYQLDFYNEDKKVYVEIDGEQHYVDPRIVESDIRRTNYFVALGWKGYRVRWSTYQRLSYDEKHKIILEIKQLLS
jgi:very-short-patch-repair endonuclease